MLSFHGTARNLLVFIICVLLNKIQNGEASSTGEWHNSTNQILSVNDILDEINYENYTKPNVSKCCDINFGFTFENKSVCVETKDEFIPEFEDWPEHSEIALNRPVNSRYEYYIGDPCSDGKYILDPSVYPDDAYSIYSNGTLLYIKSLYGLEDFCLETLNNTVRAFVCFKAEKTEYKIDLEFFFYALGMSISIPFLLATAIIYLSIDLLRDVRGKSLSCHVLSLAIGYFFLVLVQLGTNELNEDVCVAAGFIIQFFFVSAFFWLNVICYDTWRCINKDFRCCNKPLTLLAKNSEKNTFRNYCLYAFMSPIILLFVSLFMDLNPAIPQSYLKPNFGLRSCWFYSNNAALSYFYGPVGIIIFLNVIFFILTARQIYLQQKESIKNMLENQNCLNETREKTILIRFYKKTLKECLYLFGIMGINWVADVISWCIGGSKFIWLITDLFNALQGIMIFFLFVINPKKIRREIKRSKLWKLIVECKSHNKKKENERVSRHWHAPIHKDIELTKL